MILSFTGGNDKIARAINIANKILTDPSFYGQIAALHSFAYSNYTGQQIADELKNTQVSITVDTYWRPWSGATAKTQTQININTAKLNRPISSIVNTVLHESVHFVDWYVNQVWDYTDENVFEDPPVSAPYCIGAIAEKMASDFDS